MRNSRRLPIPAILVLAALMLVFPGPGASADTVYKCIRNGKPSYTTAPRDTDSQCQEAGLRDDTPNPAVVEKAQEDKKRREDADREAYEAGLKEREIRAKELEAAAAARNARAAEEQLRLMRQQPQSEPLNPMLVYPYYQPYWGGGARPPMPPRPLPPHPLPPQPRPREAGGGFQQSPPHPSPPLR